MEAKSKSVEKKQKKDVEEEKVPSRKRKREDDFQVQPSDPKKVKVNQKFELKGSVVIGQYGEMKPSELIASFDMDDTLI